MAIQIAREETRCRHYMGYTFRLAARVLLYAPSHRKDSTYHGLYNTSPGALAGTRNSSMGPPHEGSIRRPNELFNTPNTICTNRKFLSFLFFVQYIWVRVRYDLVFQVYTFPSERGLYCCRGLFWCGGRVLFGSVVPPSDTHSTHFIYGYMASDIW